MASKLVKFLTNPTVSKDDKGRTLHWICSQSDVWWDHPDNHDFIQWVFPNTVPSEAVPNSPVLTAEDCYKLGSLPRFRKTNGYWSGPVLRFMSYLGIKKKQGKISVSNLQNTWVWTGRFNHNHLRITRFLKWLCIINQRELATELVQFMKSKNGIDYNLEPTSLKYWEEAVK